MSLNKESHLASHEGEQIKMPQVQRPKVNVRSSIFQRSLVGLGNKEITLEKRKSCDSSIGTDIVSKATSFATRSQSSQNTTVTNSSLQNYNRNTNEEIGHINTKQINEERVQGNFSKFSAHRTLLKDSYRNERSTSLSNNIEKKYENKVNRTQNKWSGEGKLSNYEDNWDDTNVSVTKCTSSHPYNTSLDSRVINKSNEKVDYADNSFNKSIKDEDSGIGWPKIELEDFKKESVDGWDDTNSSVMNCESFHQHNTSKSSIQSLSDSRVVSKLDDKVHDACFSKSIKDEDSGTGWPKIELEGIKKESIDTEDGWGEISENGDDIWDTPNDVSNTSKNFKCSEKYHQPYANRISAQSLAISNRSNQYSNSKDNDKRSAKQFSEPLPISGRIRQDFNGKSDFTSRCQPGSNWRGTKQDFSGKNDYQYNSTSSSQPVSVEDRTRQDFNGRNFNQNSNSASSQSASTQSNFNSRKRNEDIVCGLPKTELTRDKNNDTYVKDTSQGEMEEESGWPKLDPVVDRRHSYDEGCWNDENTFQENNNELSGNRIKSYQHSTSAPIAQSSEFANNKNWDIPNRNRHQIERGSGDSLANLPQFERSKFEYSKQCPSKSQITRSSSFRDGTNCRDENENAGNTFSKYGRNANNQGSRSGAVDDRSIGYSVTHNMKSNTQPSFNCNDSNKSRNQGSKVGSTVSSNSNTSSTPWEKAWRANTESQIEAIQDTDCGTELEMPEPLKVQGVDSSDEWCTISETSEVSTVVLDNNSSNYERERVVESVSDPKKLTITLRCNNHPKEEIDLGDSKSPEGTPKNWKEIDKEILQIQAYSDPLESFLTSCSVPDIPAPLPVTAIEPVRNSKVSNAVLLVEKQTSEPKGCSSVTELTSGECPASCEGSENIPDARHIQEITTFLQDLEAEKSMPIEVSQKIRKDVIDVVNYHVKGYFVYCYGSYESGLAVSTSNLNLALKSDMPPRNSFLLQLQKALSKRLKGYQVEPFEEEKNPKKSKICLTETKTGITCELGYFGSCVSDYRKMDSLLSDVCRYDPRIKSLLIATRIWAEVCLINEPEEGKLHTIGYSLLMLHFLQGLEKPLLPILDIDLSLKNWGLNPLKVKNNSTIGELWLSFLKYYSSEFNWEENVVTIHCKSTVLKSSKSWERSCIAIEDPFSQINIAGSVVSSECAEGIFSCFKASYQYFSTPVDYEGVESSDSDDITDSQSYNSKKEIFSFNDITFDQNLPTFCDACEELDEPCKKCSPDKKVILQSLSVLSDSSLECINTALHDVYEEFILPDSKIEGRKAFVRNLETSVKQIYPCAKLTLFGSSVNAFGFKRSDLDICMTLNYKPRSSSEMAAMLRNLVRYLRRKPHLYDNVFGLYHAKIPIVKFHFIQEDWNCDLSFSNVLAVHNSKLLSKYALFDERCRILGYAMKLLSKKAGLDDTRSLSSYSYILAVIHYLQQVEPPVLPVFPVDDNPKKKS